VRSHLWDVLEDHLGSRDVARIIYGAIIALALVVALDDHPPDPGEMVGLLLGTAIAVGLAEMFSEAIAMEARIRRSLDRAQLRSLALESASVMFGAGFPALFFILAAAGAMDVMTAFKWAKWTGLGLICAYAFLAAKLAGSGHVRSALRALAIGAVAGALIALKALLH